MATISLRAEHLIARIAADQHGAAATRQMLAAGCTRDVIKKLVARGVLHRRHQGVYAVGHPALSREGTWMAAVLAGGDGAALSHVSAAQHWGITRRRTTQVDVSTPRYRRGIADVRTHVLRPLQERGAVTIHDGIPVTTVARTIVDLAEYVGIEELGFVMHEAAYRHGFDPAEVEAIISRNPRFRGRGRLRQALAHHVAGHTGARSRLERRVGRYLESVGVPTGIAGLKVRTAEDTYEVDRGWPDRRMYLEVDGVGHRRATTRRQDRERDRALVLAGWEKFRVDGDEFDADPAAATGLVRAAFR